MKISDAQILAMKLAEEFDEKYKKVKRGSTASVYFMDIIETLGELAGVLKVKELWQTKPELYNAKPKANLESKLVDFLYDALMIANIYDIDLEKAFAERMQQFENRFLRGQLT